MTRPRLVWWLADNLSTLLDPHEREVVWGDLIEHGASAGDALRDVGGLVIRREAARWTAWQPWMAVVGVAGVGGLMLSRFACGLSQFLSMYALSAYYGLNLGLGLSGHEELVAMPSQSLALALWSWTGGLMMGGLSRRTVWISGAVLALVWFVSAGSCEIHVFAARYHAAQRAILPLVAQAVLFLLPCVIGAQQGVRRQSWPLRIVLLLAIALVAVTWLEHWANVRFQAAMWNWPSK